LYDLRVGLCCRLRYDSSTRTWEDAMKTRLLVTLAVVVALAGPLAAGAARAADRPTTYYLSLGDSLAASFQPNLDVTHGYAEQLYASLAAGDPELQLVKLGCGGETTVTFIVGQPGGCQPRFLYPPDFYHGGTQLSTAVRFLQAHRGDTSLVTIDIGSNDVFDCIAALDVACFDAGLADVEEHLPEILSSLRAAAGAGVPIVGMAYYDPFSVYWFDDPAAGEAADGLMAELNDSLRQIYGAAGVPVAPVDASFEVGTFPASALNVCRWTWLCTRAGDPHPTTTGYGVIADAFERVLPFGG
jgi:lysophospholipase L1-like esterase